MIHDLKILPSFYEDVIQHRKTFEVRKTVERSMISPDYARNFICDNILGIDSGFTQPLLFNI